MKKCSLLISAFLITASFELEASFNTDSVFNEANRNYINQNYEEAIEQYKSILDQGYESAELYYNLGNAYYKITNYPKAILFYEKALLHDPRNKNIKFNLAKAQIYIVDKINEIPEFIIKKWWHVVVTWFRSDFWAKLSLLSFVIGIVGLLIFSLTKKISLRRTGFYTGLILILFSIFSFIMAAEAKSVLINSNGAIVMTPTVTVKGSPSNSSTDLFIIHEGTKVYILDEFDEWFEIKLSDGKQGWLLKTDIEPI
jgi:tetratricopeptide (TPR) repeat protein